MFGKIVASAACVLSLAAPVFGAAFENALAARAVNNSLAACPGYKATNVRTTGNSMTATLKLAGKACNAYGTDISPLTLLVEYQTGQRLHVKIYDTAENVYQVPQSVLPDASNNQSNSNFKLAKQDLKFNYVANPFSFSVTRQSTGEVLFNTAGSPIIFESQYLGLRTQLPANPNLYGLGEDTDPFRLNTTNYIRTLWSRDAYTVPTGQNLYGNHPVYYDHRGANGTHAVFLRNSNGMDIKINNTASTGQYLEYNTLGGVFDFYFLSGPTPKDVASQYAETVGMPVMMPYWGLGFHQCRYGMQDVYEVAGVVANYSQAGIPLETMWTDIDYMNLRRVFTLDPERFPLHKMQQLVDYLHSHQQHYVVMVDPAVWYGDYDGFNNGVAAGAFLLNSSGLPYQGVVWPGVTAFPDWFASGTQGYWNQEFYNFFHPNTGLDIDALWIDMNEASNFCAYPCINPVQYAINAGDPPIPPAVRLYSPYKVPGFPADFQPHCVSYVNFNVHAETYYGENIFVIGNQPTIGNNDVSQSAAMNANNYPTWQATVQFPVNTKVVYSYARQEEGGTWIYEQITRNLTTGGCGSTVSTSDTITTPEGTPPSKVKRAMPMVKAVKAPVAVTAAGSQMGLPNRDFLNPKYGIHNANGPLSANTINVTIVHQNGLVEYDTHNMYGTMMSAASREAMLNRRPGLRPLVITRSTFAGAGRQVGHWLGDNVSNWPDYRISIAQLMEFASLFQLPMVGSDVCGYAGDTNEFLCARWAMLGAFSVFYRNHDASGTIPQEYYRWPLVTAAAKKAIGARYQLLDYIYTGLYRQTQTGNPCINPMFFMYPEDSNTFGLQLQYFYGDAIMIAPVVEDNATYVDFYVPNDIFYDFWTHAPVQGKGAMMNLPSVDFTELPMYYKGGNIIPLRAQSTNTTEMLRQQPFSIIIAPGSDGTATGSLYIDEGTKIAQPSITNVNFYYSAATGTFVMNGTMDYAVPAISSIVVLGAGQAAASSKVAATAGTKAPTYDATAQSLTYVVDIPFSGSYSVKLH